MCATFFDLELVHFVVHSMAFDKLGYFIKVHAYFPLTVINKSVCPTEVGYVFVSECPVCFKLIQQNMTLTDARVYCEQYGGQLLRIQNAQHTAVAAYLCVMGRPCGTICHGSKKHMAQPGLDPRTSRILCEHSAH